MKTYLFVVLAFVLGCAVAYPIGNHSGFISGAEWRAVSVVVVRQSSNAAKDAQRNSRKYERRTMLAGRGN